MYADALLLLAFSQYLIRAAQACYDNGSLSEAFNLFEEVKQTVETLNPDTAIVAALAALDRRLRPFEMLPDELLALIFEHVHQDWEKLPSPLQLLHICKRWREIAMATPTLWQDTRILRVHSRAVTKKPLYFPPVQKAFRFGQTEPETGYICSRADVHKHKLVDLCAALSCNTLSLLELEVHNSLDAAEVVRRLFVNVSASKAHLKIVAFVHTNKSQRQRASGYSSALSKFATLCLDFVMQCPNVEDVQLFVGELMRGEEHIAAISDESLAARAEPSFRRLQLDCFGGFTNSKGAQMRQRFLQRSSKVRNLSLRNVPSQRKQEGDGRVTPFALQLIASCAEALVHLEVDGQATIFRSLRAQGVKSFPHLTHLRHVTHEHVSARTLQSDIDGLLFPKLESIEAPVDVIIAMPTVPPLVVVRFDDQLRAESDCAALAEWLLALDSKKSPASLTVTASCEVVQEDLFAPIIEALTPSAVGMVACPRLTELKFMHRSAYERNSSDISYSLDPTPLPLPIWRETWAFEGDVSDVDQLAAERLRLSQGLPPTEEASNTATPHTLAQNAEAGPAASKAESAAAWDTCEALQLVELEGCYVDVEAWERMQSSATLFKVRPNPDEMANLPLRTDEMVRRKKRKFNFHHLF